MIPISLSWDTRKRSVVLKCDGFVSSRWKDGKVLIRILGLAIPLPLKKREIRLPGKLPRRWIYWREFFSFLLKWKLRKMEGTLSFSDPMVNGVLYGWMSAIQAGRVDRKNHLTVNFLGKNWWRGEATLSLKIFFHDLRSWILPLIHEMRGEKSQKRR